MIKDPFVQKVILGVLAASLFFVSWKFLDGEAQLGMLGLATGIAGWAGLRRPGDVDQKKVSK